MELLAREQVIINPGLTTKEGVIRLLSEKAVELGIADNCQQLVESFMAREALGPTGIGDGIAIPHAKSSCVTRVAVMIVKSEPMPWESFDDTPVSLAIALLVPQENTDNIHLKVLSSLTRKLVNEEFKQSLFSAQTQEEFMALFEEFSSAV